MLYPDKCLYRLKKIFETEQCNSGNGSNSAGYLYTIYKKINNIILDFDFTYIGMYK